MNGKYSVRYGNGCCRFGRAKLRARDRIVKQTELQIVIAGGCESAVIKPALIGKLGRLRFGVRHKKAE